MAVYGQICGMNSLQGLSRGRAALDTKCGILIRVAVWTMLLGVVMSIYCDDQNCYDILGYVAWMAGSELIQICNRFLLCSHWLHGQC